MLSKWKAKLAVALAIAAGVLGAAPSAQALVPNDPLYATNQWNLRLIHAPEGWAIRTDASSIIVCDIDSGVRAAHEDLAVNMWHNPSDGTVGYNAIDGSHNPIPATNGNGHGTGTASILGAVGNNAKGISGVAWSIKIMACRYDDAATDAVKETQISNCIDFAIANGAKIINASWSVVNTGALRAAFLRAQTAGIIIVGAAGNSSFDLDSFGTLPYPQGCDLDNVVLVAAVTENDVLTSYSGYAYNRVKLGAPGGSMTSGNAQTFTPICGMGSAGTDYPLTSFGATSAATPHVGAALALVKAQFPGETYQQSIYRVLRSVDPVASLGSKKTTTGGRLNLFNALSAGPGRPANDNFANAYTLTGTTAASTGLNLNVAATRETGEPNHAGNAGSTSVWWNWTAPASGTATIMTANSSFDTSLGVYTGSSVSALTTVASNNDVSGSDKTSTVVFTAVGGTTYRIAVDGWRTDNFSKTTGAVNLSVALTNITTPVPSPVGTGVGLRGDYYDNVDFTSPRTVRTDSVINLTVAPTPPPPMLGFPSQLGGSTFSARWSGQVEPRYSETYTFYTNTDDGVRLWVNGQLLVDNWTGHALTENSGAIALTAAQKYDIKMEYYQGTGAGIATLSWSCTDLPKEVVPQTQLYPNAGPTVSITSPANNAVYLDPATVTITASAADSDGTIAKVEFYNGTTKLGEDTSSTGGWTYAWTGMAVGTYSVTARALDNLGAGTTSAAINVIVNPGVGTGLLGEYFNDTGGVHLAGSPVFVDSDEVIDFAWGTGSPDPVVHVDAFSARWTGKIKPLYSELYNLYTLSDDGVRLYINGQMIVNNWTVHGPTENSASINFVAGQQYDIVMEYFENASGATAKLSWASPSQPKVVVPASQLYGP